MINQDNAASNPAPAPAAPADEGVLEVREPVEEEPEPVPVLEEEPEEQDQRTVEPQPQEQDVVVTQDQSGLPRFAAVPTQTVVARAPLTPATARFVATPAIHHSHGVVAHTDTPVAFGTRTVAAPVHTVAHTVAAPVHTVAHTVAAPARAVATPVATPVVNNFALADVASTGFFTFPGAGIAFNF